MAADMFLKIDDVKGESIDGKHKDEIDVLSWSWTMSQSGSTHQGPGGGAGKVNVQDLTLIKYVDRASPNLMQKCCNGKHFKEAILTVRKAGGQSPVEYLVIKMNDIIISAISSGEGSGGDRLTERVALNFAKFEVSYTPQKPDGSADAKLSTTWNIASNAPT